ncbi:MAG: putative Ig domain-containing protein, partial [Thiogranum sp.]|nr:putative Ig domain-containing protein [Thiogranum sp.]
NDAPIISGTPPTTVAQGALYTFAPTAADIDGDTLLFTMTNNPAWLSIDETTGVVSGTPTNADVTTTTGIIISVNDQQGEVNSTASLTPFDLTVTAVAPVNVAPTISGTPQTRVGAVDDVSTAVLTGGMTSTYSFTPTASDADGDALTFSIVNKPTWAVFDYTTGALTGTPTAAELGTTVAVTISVSDGTDTTSLAAFDVSVVAGFNEALYADPLAPAVSAARRLYQANDGSLVDGNGWASGTADPASIRFTFDSTKTLYKVSLVDVPGDTNFLTGVIEFSDGSSISVSETLPDDGTPREFVFAPIDTDFVQVTVSTATASTALTEVMAYSALDPGQTELASDLFNDGDVVGWAPVNNCELGTSAWAPNYKFYNTTDYQPSLRQTGDCRGFTVEGVEDGTYQLLDTATADTGADLRLMLRSDNDGTEWVYGVMGVLFAYQDDDNYYRFETRNGYRKLRKRVNGVFTELATSPQSYALGDRPADYSQSAWVNLRVVLRNGVIIVYMDGEKVLT